MSLSFATASAWLGVSLQRSVSDETALAQLTPNQGSGIQEQMCIGKERSNFRVPTP